MQPYNLLLWLRDIDSLYFARTIETLFCEKSKKKEYDERGHTLMFVRLFVHKFPKQDQLGYEIVFDTDRLAPCFCTFQLQNDSLAPCFCTFQQHTNFLAPCFCTFQLQNDVMAPCFCTFRMQNDGFGTLSLLLPAANQQFGTLFLHFSAAK